MGTALPDLQRADRAIHHPATSSTANSDLVHPGQWMLHCHNAYHGEAGMMTVLSYVR
ncbi:multicopper oxidase domain-containing protein [Nocardia sp. NBC_00403]|uniref:multicopper oxidase domain-containing protein n=1 Tax=Nocardia sp. NBC_00403 TaxID=2975990 RepID=UPI003FA5B872